MHEIPVQFLKLKLSLPQFFLCLILTVHIGFHLHILSTILVACKIVSNAPNAFAVQHFHLSNALAAMV